MPKKLWFKGFLLILIVIAVCSLAFSLTAIPLTRNMTYRMSEQSAIAALDRVNELVATTYQEIESYRRSALEDKKRELRNIAEIGGCFIKLQYAAAQRGDISEAEAKKRALDGMRTLRYGKDDYLWISDFNSVLISHPDPKLFGADFSKVRDVNNNLIVPPMVAVAREHGQGFTSYWWNRLGYTEPSEKLTFSKLFEPWQWVFGTGVYVDDISSEVNLRRQALISRLRKLLSRITIADTGYMFIFDDKLNMIIHPNRQLEGKNFSAIPDPRTGKPLVNELINAAKSGKPQVYLWDRPTEPGHYVYKKISWMRYFPEFKWYIGSSVYTDDLFKQSQLLTKRLILIASLAFLLSLALGTVVIKRFLRPVEHLSNIAQRIRQGEAKLRSNLLRNDELGMLSREFDHMLDTLDDMIENLDEKVQEKTSELSRQYKELDFANNEIKESIQYARRIQQAILPGKGTLPAAISDHFVIWKPKDIIGGDIFWLHNPNPRFLAAVIDCTGHGVPGATMTMIANMALNRVVQEVSDYDPAAVLKALNRLVRITLGQHSAESSTNDGLDIGLCLVDPHKRSLVFSGARLNLLVIQGGTVEEIQGDRMSIGYKTSDPDYTFAANHITLDKGAAIYLTTDGILGQAGGQHNLPFGRRRFIDVVSRHSNDSMTIQKQVIEQALSTYKGEEEQRDDITVVGFRL
jgi:signal transduction histidine kinase